PAEAEQERKSRNQISGSAPAGALRIERYVFRRNDDEPEIFHTRSLARAQHEKEEIDCDKSEVTHAINSEDTPVRREIFRHFKAGRYKKDAEDQGYNCQLDQSCRNAWRQHLWLVFGQSRS